MFFICCDWLWQFVYSLTQFCFHLKIYYFGAKTHFHFYIHLFYTFLIILYGLWETPEKKQIKRFTYFPTKRENAKKFLQNKNWLILASKRSLVFTFIFKVFSHKIWSMLIKKYPLVRLMAKFVIKRVDVFLPQKMYIF